MYGGLEEEVYMEQPPSFVAQGSLETLYVDCVSHFMVWTVSLSFVWKVQYSNLGVWHDHSGVDHSVFYQHLAQNLCIYLVVYVDDIIITVNDQVDIANLKQYLFQHFQTKDLGRLKYFLGIEVIHSR